MRITISGATGLIGTAVIERLRRRDAEITVLSRDPEKAQRRLGVEPGLDGGLTAVRWDPMREPAPVQALSGRDAVVHLAGEEVAQRWSGDAKSAIRDSRVLGTRNLLSSLRQASPRPAALISASAIGIYGARREEPLDEDASHGRGFLAEICEEWESEAQAASQLGVRVAIMRIGVVLSARGGALAKMLPPFKMGVGGPVAGGRQFVSWIHLDDLTGLFLAAIEHESWSGPINATAPEPVTNWQLSKALGKALHRPSLLPVPAAALKLLYGEMSEIVTTGQRVLPAKALISGYEFEHPGLDEALRSALA